MPMSQTERRKFRTVINDSFLLATVDMLAIAGTPACAITYAALESVSREGAGDKRPHELSIPEIIRLQGPILCQSPNTVSKCMRQLADRGVIRFDTERHGRDNRYRFWMDRRRIDELVKKPEFAFPGAQNSDAGIAKMRHQPPQNCDAGIAKLGAHLYRDWRDGKREPPEKGGRLDPAKENHPLFLEIGVRMGRCTISDPSPETAQGRIFDELVSLPFETQKRFLDHLEDQARRIERAGQEIDSWGYLVNCVRAWVGSLAAPTNKPPAPRNVAPETALPNPLPPDIIPNAFDPGDDPVLQERVTQPPRTQNAPERTLPPKPRTETREDLLRSLEQSKHPQATLFRKLYEQINPPRKSATQERCGGIARAAGAG